MNTLGAWGYVGGAVVMTAGGLMLLRAWLPPRWIGRHEPGAGPARAEAGADATYAAELLVMRTEIVVDGGPQPAPNYFRSGEYALVERPPGDTQAWLTQECLVEGDAAEAEPVEVPPAAVVPHWMRPALDDEPTPLAPGVVPQLPDDLDPSTIGWNRAEWMERLRRYEYELAKAEPEMADEELAA